MKRPDVDKETLRAIRRDIEDMKHRIATEPAPQGMVPLKIECMMTSCTHGRHCLDHIRKPRRGSERPDVGSCRDCGEPVVGLPAADGRAYEDLEEIRLTCVSQQSELMRAHYWQVPIDRWAYNQALRAGRRLLMEKIDQQVAKAMDPDNHFAGKSAPYERNIVAYAQHATATCCRRCAAVWHGTPAPDTKRKPSPRQLRHLQMIARAYIDLRLPDLPEEPMASVANIHVRDLMDSRQSEERDGVVFNVLAHGGDPAGLLVPFNTTLELSAASKGILVSRRLEAMPGA